MANEPSQVNKMSSRKREANWCISFNKKLHLHHQERRKSQDTATYRAVSIWVIIRNIDSELEHTILVEPMPYEYHTKPHCK